MNDYPSFKTDPVFVIVSVLTILILAFMVFLPLSEALGRHILFFSIPGSVNWVQHMVLWLGLLGGVLATILGQHLSISTSKVFRKNRFFRISGMLSSTGTVIFLLFITLASIILVQIQTASPEKLGGWLPGNRRTRLPHAPLTDEDFAWLREQTARTMPEFLDYTP